MPALQTPSMTRFQPQSEAVEDLKKRLEEIGEQMVDLGSMRVQGDEYGGSADLPAPLTFPMTSDKDFCPNHTTFSEDKRTLNWTFQIHGKRSRRD
jgi:hypothetical protein